MIPRAYWLPFVLLCAACAPAVRPAAAPAPGHPDLGAVMERYYEGVSDRRWAFAAGMLSARLSSHTGAAVLAQRYASYPNAEIRLREDGHGAVHATLRAGVRHFDETARLVWTGDRWAIDQLTP